MFGKSFGMLYAELGLLVKTHLPPLFRKKVKTALDTAQRCKSGLNSDLCYQVRQLWNKAYPQVRVRRLIEVSGVGYRLHLKPHALGGRQPAPEARSEVELNNVLPTDFHIRQQGFRPASTSAHRRTCKWAGRPPYEEKEPQSGFSAL